MEPDTLRVFTPVALIPTALYPLPGCWDRLWGWGPGSLQLHFMNGLCKPQPHQISVLVIPARGSVYLRLLSGYTGLHNVRQPFLPMGVFSTNPRTCVPQS
jgi:hypothetical protein